LSSYFVDTSALAKRYVMEKGTRWMRTITRPTAHHEIIVSELAMVEMFALMERRQRMGVLIPSSASRLRSAFVRHLKT
jgi:predicted nucleic acid-binding protein